MISQASYSPYGNLEFVFDGPRLIKSYATRALGMFEFIDIPAPKKKPTFPCRITWANSLANFSYNADFDLSILELFIIFCLLIVLFSVGCGAARQHRKRILRGLPPLVFNPYTVR